MPWFATSTLKSSSSPRISSRTCSVSSPANSSKSPPPPSGKRPRSASARQRHDPRTAHGVTRVRRIAIRPLLAIALVLAFAFPAVLALSTRQLHIEDFHSETIVMPDGTIDVTETIQAHFIGGPWHGLYRTIPVEYVTPQGLNYSLFLDIKRVAGANGRTLKYESSRERHYRKLKIYVPNADNSTQT